LFLALSSLMVTSPRPHDLMQRPKCADSEDQPRNHRSNVMEPAAHCTVSGSNGLATRCLANAASISSIVNPNSSAISVKAHSQISSASYWVRGLEGSCRFTQGLGDGGASP